MVPSKPWICVNKLKAYKTPARLGLELIARSCPRAPLCLAGMNPVHTICPRSPHRHKEASEPRYESWWVFSPGLEAQEELLLSWG